MLTDRFSEAVALAVRAHKGQVRKSTAIPYVSHVLGVASLVLDHGGDEDQAIAALLHDVLEDCGAHFEAQIRERFGDRVAGIVRACTDGEPDAPRDQGNWTARKSAYLAHLREVPLDTLLVSACDKLHNARAIASDHSHLGDAVFERFNAKKAGTQWYYRELSSIVTDRFGDIRLSCDLAETVAHFAPD